MTNSRGSRKNTRSKAPLYIEKCIRKGQDRSVESTNSGPGSKIMAFYLYGL